MRIPVWFQVLWWFAIVITLTLFLSARYGRFLDGTAKPQDIFLSLIWFALILMPLFSEVKLFGVSLKREIESLRSDVSHGFTNLRSDIRNAIEVRAQVNPVFNIPGPPPDAQLLAIEQRLTRAFDEALRSRGLTPVQPREIEAPDDVLFLFRARYNVEKEVRRLWQQRMDQPQATRYRSVSLMAEGLEHAQIIDPRIASGIIEVYRATSPGVHGVAVTPGQVRFVHDVAPSVIAALRAIE